MNHDNFMYLSKKVSRYEQLQIMKENLAAVQERLVNDEPLTINVGDDEYCCAIEFGDKDVNKVTNCLVKSEHEELMREIKDNLIDAIGMKIVEIEEKMKEL